jgi:hypothetical protein
MLNTSRSRVRALAAIGMAAVAATITTVTYQASAAEVTAPTEAAGSRPVALPAVPDAIKPPAGSRPVGTFKVVTGTQNYTCVVAADATTGAFTGASVPEALLSGSAGRIQHFVGPSWQSQRDGSLVTATKTASSAVTGAIPELLLTVATHSGKGILTRVDYITRLSTSGGVAPTTSCQTDEVVKVPYNAVYVFWDAPTPAPTPSA